MKAERTKVTLPKRKRGAIPQLFIIIYLCQTTIEACFFTKVKSNYSMHRVNNLNLYYTIPLSKPQAIIKSAVRDLSHFV